MSEQHSGYVELEGRLVRLEVTQDNIKEHIREIKDMFGKFTATEEASMALISKQIGDIARSHEAFQADIKGRLWGMRAAWAAIIGVGALVWKLIRNQHA